MKCKGRLWQRQSRGRLGRVMCGHGGCPQRTGGVLCPGRRGRQGGLHGGLLGSSSRPCGQTRTLGEMSCQSPREHLSSTCLDEKKGLIGSKYTRILVCPATLKNLGWFYLDVSV